MRPDSGAPAGAVAAQNVVVLPAAVARTAKTPGSRRTYGDADSAPSPAKAGVAGSPAAVVSVTMYASAGAGTWPAPLAFTTRTATLLVGIAPGSSSIITKRTLPPAARL